VSVVLILGFASGVIVGLCRASIFALALIILLVAAGAIIIDGAAGQNHLSVVLDVFAAITITQIGYVVGGNLSARAFVRGPKMLRAMQIAIGDELRRSYAPPAEMPQKIARLVNQLSKQDTGNQIVRIRAISPG
jgi:hypothetical protein